MLSQQRISQKNVTKGTVLTLFQDGKAPVELTVKVIANIKFDLLSFEGHPSINDVENIGMAY